MPKIICGLLLAATLALSTQIVRADSSSNIDPVSKLPNNVAAALADQESELMQCAALYGIAYQAEAKGGATDTDLKSMAKTRDTTMRMGYTIGARIGMTEEVQLAVYKMFLEKFIQELHGTWANMPVLNKYFQPCKGVVENPEARFNYWLNFEKHRIPKP